MSNSSLKALKDKLLGQEVKDVHIIYSGLQEYDFGICADISLILIQNITEELENIQSVQDIVKVIKRVKVQMYNTVLKETQEQIIVQSYKQHNANEFISNILQFHKDDINLEIIGEAVIPNMLCSE